MIGIVTNPKALGITHDPALPDRLQSLVGAGGRVVATHTLADLERELRGFRDAGARMVGICGGDGTNLAVLTAATRVWDGAPMPPFAILRGGTANTVAKNFGLRGRPEVVLQRLLAGMRDGTARTIEHDVVRVNGDTGFMFGALMSARFMDAYYGGPMTGMPWAAVLTARVMGSTLFGGPFARDLFAPADADVVVDGERAPFRAFTLIVAATIPNVGLGIRVAWRARAEAGRFHFVGTGLSAARLVAQAPRVFGGRPLRGATHLDTLARSVQISFAETQTYVLDGDLYRTREVAIEAGRRVRLTLPPTG